MALFEHIESWSEKITRMIALISLTGLLILASATVADVLLRWLFNSPLLGLTDTYSLFTAVIIASCFPLCIYQRGNITIRFMGNIFGPKTKNILDTFGNLVTMVVFAFMAWQLWKYANELAQDTATTFVYDWPLSPWWRAVTVIIALCIPVTLVTVIQYFKSFLITTSKTESSGTGSN
jgi:TRAP-type transport system small permease protein